MSQIFISYSRKDQGLVDDLVRDLSKRGLSCWLDRQDIVGGTAWRREIGTAISQCDAFLVVLSPESVASENVKRELGFAESHGRRILPLRYQRCVIPPDMGLTLSNLQWIDFAEPTYEDAFAQLVKALKPEAMPELELRPKLVWWISGFYILSGAYYLYAFILYLLRATDLTGEQADFFKSLPPLEFTLGLVIAILNMAAAVVLFQLKAQALHLFFISWVLNTIYSTVAFFSTNDSSVWLGILVSYGFSTYVLYYTYKLKQQDTLNRHQQEQPLKVGDQNSLSQHFQHGGQP